MDNLLPELQEGRNVKSRDYTTLTRVSTSVLPIISKLIEKECTLFICPSFYFYF